MTESERATTVSKRVETSRGDGTPERAELDAISITGIDVFAHHGVLAFERERGQRFVIDITVWLDTRPAARGDDLADTVDYGVLAAEVHAAVSRDPVDLLETIAQRVADVALAHGAVERVQVTVHKPDAPIEVPFGDVTLSITRSRS